MCMVQVCELLLQCVSRSPPQKLSEEGVQQHEDEVHQEETVQLLPDETLPALSTETRASEILRSRRSAANTRRDSPLNPDSEDLSPRGPANDSTALPTHSPSAAGSCGARHTKLNISCIYNTKS